MAASLLPQRTSLVDETVRVLRESLQSGRWGQVLPGERRLCDEWRISRPTLRAAVSVLSGEGLLKVAHGRPTEIAAPAGSARARVAASLTVGLISPESLHAMPPFSLLWLDELRGQLAAEGHLLQVHVGRSWCNGRKPDRSLAALTDAAPASIWILYRSTEAMQRWFEEKQVPCVIVGSPFTGVRLASVDQDYRAVCRHAVGTLVRHGHTRVALVIQEPRFAGDLESEAGFREGMAAARAGVAGAVYHHDGSRSQLLRVADQLASARRRPSGVLVARSACALTLATALQQRGLRIPQDIALISRDDDSYLDDSVPSISRYAVAPTAFAKRIFHLVRQPSARRDTKIMPAFLRRESL
jgi:LacI family transcriptional regulator